MKQQSIGEDAASDATATLDERADSDEERNELGQGDRVA